MGSVRFNRQRQAWFIDYVDATGRRMRQTIGDGEENRRLAKRALAQREAEAQLGFHRLPASHTPRFSEWAADWLRRGSARLKPKTQESYEDAIERLVPAFGEQRLGGISRRDIETWLAGTHLSRPHKGQKKAPLPLSRASVNATLHVLKFILRDAHEHGYLTEDPATKVKPLKVTEREDALQFLTPEEIGRLLDAAEASWRTLYLLAIHSGLRRGELLGLRWRDLDLRARLLHVRRSLGRIRNGGGYAVLEVPLKTRYSRRIIDLSPTVVQALLVHPAGDDSERDYVFRSLAGGAIDPDNVDRVWKRHLTAAGLADRPFHATRHTHASLLIAAGVHPKAIQARLGHASITTTLNTYGHLMPSAFEEIGNRVDQLLTDRKIKTSSVASLASSAP